MTIDLMTNDLMTNDLMTNAPITYFTQRAKENNGTTLRTLYSLLLCVKFFQWLVGKQQWQKSSLNLNFYTFQIYSIGAKSSLVIPFNT